MKNFKRMLCLVISVLIIVSSMAIGVVAAADISGHWAENDINELINLGVVSGDSTGAIRPDEKITRAEFVKIINKSFDLKKVASSNFNDVSGDKWYANEFLIAKGEGYITGDQNSNANPDVNITRAEVSVILTRVLGVNNLSSQLNFIDLSEIPSWAKTAIGTLVSYGIINGYEDKTFKANSPISRAESFSIIVRTRKSDIMDDSKFTGNKDDNLGNMGGLSGTGNGSGSSSGSGGGSGSSSSQTALVTPIITRFNSTTGELVYSAVKNAYNYELKAVADGKTYKITVDTNNVNITNLLDKIYSETKEPVLTTKVSVKANAKSGYKDSSYSKEIEITKSFDCIDTPVVITERMHANQMVFMTIEWSDVPFAASYEVKGYVNNKENNNFYTYDSSKNLILINDLSITDRSDVFISIKSIVDTSLTDKKNSYPTNVIINELLLGGGNGSAESPFIISTADDFFEVQNYPSKVFVITKDINIGTIETCMDSFSGKLIGNKNYPNDPSEDGSSKPVISMNIEKGSGIFKTITGTDTLIKDLKFAGSVNGNGVGTTGVGSIAGDLQAGTIEGCVNYANIFGNINTGGIVGKGAATGSINNCYNYGNITTEAHSDSNKGGGQNVGGIAGFPNGTITNCGNYGEIRGVKTVGGVIGAAYGDVSKCFNIGNVIGTSSGVGGVVGNVKSKTISQVYNHGTVTGVAPIGGILGAISTSGAIDKAYTTSAAVICGVTDNVVLTDCFYVEGTYAGTGATKVTAQQIKDGDEIVKPLLDGGFILNSQDGNEFLSIIDNPQIQETSIPTMGVANLSSFSYLNTATISWVEPTNAAYTGSDIIVINAKTNELIKEDVVPKGTTEIKLEELPYDVYCKVIVVANYSNAMVGMPSNLVFYIEPQDLKAPAEVKNFVAVGGNTAVDFSWTNPTDVDFTSVKISVLDGDVVVGDGVITINAPYTDYVFENLENGKTYKAIIRTSDDKNNLSQGITKTFTCNENVLPMNKATDLNVSYTLNNQQESYIVTWNSDEQGAKFDLSVKIGDVINKYTDLTEKSFDISSLALEGGNAEITVTTKKSGSIRSVSDIKGFNFDYAGGTGETEDKYIISTERHLNNVRYALDKHFKQINDIVVADTSFAPIGANLENPTSASSLFTGTYVGADELVKKINLNVDAMAYAKNGLFASVRGEIKYIGIEGKLHAPGKNYVGAIAGDASGATIENCYNAAEIVGNNYVGGLVGNTGTGTKILKSHNTGALNMSVYGGGLVGACYDTTISECYNAGTINATGAYIGGLMGNNGNSTKGNPITILNSFNIGEIKGAWPAGGLAGYLTGLNTTVSVTNSFNAGNIIPTNTKTIYEIATVANASTITITGAYYMQRGSNVDGANATKLTTTQFLDLTSFSGYLDTIWQVGKNENCNIIELINNPTKVEFMADIIPPAAPNVNSQAPTKTGGIITWIDPADKDLLSLSVTLKEGADGVPGYPVIVDKGIEKIKLEGLTVGTEYTVKIASVDSSGNKSEPVITTITPSATALEPTTIKNKVVDQVIQKGKPITIDLTNVFEKDAGIDELTFISNIGSIQGNILTITPDEAGIKTVKVTASYPLVADEFTKFSLISVTSLDDFENDANKGGDMIGMTSDITIEPSGWIFQKLASYSSWTPDITYAHSRGVIATPQNIKEANFNMSNKVVDNKFKINATGSTVYPMMYKIFNSVKKGKQVVTYKFQFDKDSEAGLDYGIRFINSITNSTANSTFTCGLSQSGGNLAWTTYQYDGNKSKIYTSDFAIEKGKWYMIRIEYDEPNNKVNVYANGQLISFNDPDNSGSTTTQPPITHSTFAARENGVGAIIFRNNVTKDKINQVYLDDFAIDNYTLLD